MCPKSSLYRKYPIVIRVLFFGTHCISFKFSNFFKYCISFKFLFLWVLWFFSHGYKTLCSYPTINFKAIRAVKLLQYVIVNLKGFSFFVYTLGDVCYLLEIAHKVKDINQFVKPDQVNWHEIILSNSFCVSVWRNFLMFSSPSDTVVKRSSQPQ